MSMQLSDDDLIDDSGSMQKMTVEGESSVERMQNVESISIPHNVSDQMGADNAAPMIDGNLTFKVTKDRYVGAIDPVTKLRNGQGTYTYTNPFFQYQGWFEHGKKTGEGVLLMRDGSQYSGMFENGEIMGQGQRTYDDGTEFIGEFVKGEKNGYGEISYGQRNAREEYYKGNWVMNVRNGFGQLLMRNGTVFKGNFVNNQPNGDCQIIFPDEATYSGEVSRGVMHGIGELKQANGFGYAGKFENGIRSGTGRFYIQNGTYSLEGTFENDKPTMEANQVLFELVSPFFEEEVVDPKAKKDPKAVKKDAPFTEEEEAQYGNKKIYLECKSDLEPKEVRFRLRIVHQGPDYEDPNPPEEDEKAKKKPAGKGAAVPDEPEIRMITPEPIVMEQEQGRVFAVELGQNVKILLDDKKEEAASLKEQGQEIPEEFYKNKWVRFYTDQRAIPKPPTGIPSSKHSSIEEQVDVTGNSMEELKNQTSRRSLQPVYPEPVQEMIVKMQSGSGVVELGELTFRLNDEFRAGSYILVCKDVTPGLPPRMQMKHTKILVKLIDLDPPPEEEQQTDKKGKPAGKKK